MEPIHIPYKGAYASIDLDKRQIGYSGDAEERVKRELMLICWYYIQCYDKNKSVPLFEDARRFAALVAMPKKFWGDITRHSIEELVEKADVTEEFAYYRISLEVQNN